MQGLRGLEYGEGLEHENVKQGKGQGSLKSKKALKIPSDLGTYIPV